MLKDLNPTIYVRNTYRIEKALIHELLHLKLIPMGFPIFEIDDPIEESKKNLAQGIINNAAHAVMWPIYLDLGYEKDKFLGPSGDWSEIWKKW